MLVTGRRNFAKNFVTWLIAVFIILAVFTFFNPSQWLKGDQTRAAILMIGLLLVVGVTAKLVTYGLWWLFGTRASNNYP